MNIDATETDLVAAAECLKLAAILDDRAPRADKARIAAWGEKIHTHKLNRPDLLDGLQAYYDAPSDRAIQIGDLIQHAKAARRARIEKEDDAVREDRRTAADRKAADDTRSVLAGVTFGAAPRTPELEAAERGLHCAVDKASAQEAIRGYLTARKVAMRRGPAPKRASA